MTALGVDCEVHVPSPPFEALLPHIEDVWRDVMRLRGIAGFASLNEPGNAPVGCRPDWASARDPRAVAARVLDGRGMGFAILHCDYPAAQLHDPHLGGVLARAVNDWLAETWLAADPRFRGSILVAAQEPSVAVDEIERRAGDRRFVQVVLPAGLDLPLGRSLYRPMLAAAARHRLPVALHAGTAHRWPHTASGWPSYHLEAHVDLAGLFQAQIASLVTHGVFGALPDLGIVLLESGATWMPAFLWRFAKFWRGDRIEVPWIDRSPAEIVRDHVRLTLQPFDAPDAPGLFARFIEHLGSEAPLLYASDDPHWHFDGQDAFPAGATPAQRRRFAVDNPRATYPRLEGSP